MSLSSSLKQVDGLLPTNLFEFQSPSLMHVAEKFVRDELEIPPNQTFADYMQGVCQGLGEENVAGRDLCENLRNDNGSCWIYRSIPKHIFKNDMIIATYLKHGFGLHDEYDAFASRSLYLETSVHRPAREGEPESHITDTFPSPNGMVCGRFGSGKLELAVRDSIEITSKETWMRAKELLFSMEKECVIARFAAESDESLDMIVFTPDQMFSTYLHSFCDGNMTGTSAGDFTFRVVDVAYSKTDVGLMMDCYKFAEFEYTWMNHPEITFMVESKFFLHEEAQSMAVALCMMTHGRLGKDSLGNDLPGKGLSQDVIKMVLCFANPRELKGSEICRFLHGLCTETREERMQALCMLSS